jgi:hypothetical protein
MGVPAIKSLIKFYSERFNLKVWSVNVYCAKLPSAGSAAKGSQIIYAIQQWQPVDMTMRIYGQTSLYVKDNILSRV